MVTREDLKTLSSESFYQGHTRDVVQYNDKHYIVGSVSCPVDANDEEAFFNWIESLGAADAFPILLGISPLNETWVMEAKWDSLEEWIPKNECGPQCATGVCNKRVATNKEVGSQDLGYSMLIAHLNA